MAPAPPSPTSSCLARLVGSYRSEQLDQRVARAYPTRAVRASYANDLSGGAHGLHLFLERTLRQRKGARAIYGWAALLTFWFRL